ncbi:PucR family transcriptional regulator [Bifidobacterium vespertilionis]|uniref:PucR family transcriptional regulator n=1 Tax=Bifidobacterium vespertilionis TaxID=2562524 RepID=A0A5J5DVD5_9BIFI|nr:PucR family transcriptional regulator [Bifidobacterium vespertilionis]KAA8815712.1 PucR family transcriptional regulator [Bifidobacterium vespertilionis]KAA8820859.1 PucR family transcriptional regulator [Bifidobacterium vespertilionis]
MSVTMWDVFRDPVFRQCDPLIAAGRAGLDHEIRWAYTQERYDVTKFLSGGELLIIEGSSLAALDDAALQGYIDALADAGVSGLAIELVDYFRDVPSAIVSEADSRGLPVIGMRKRAPFVDLCQEINTRIVREQMLANIEMDTLSTSLRRRLADAASASDVASVLYRVLGEPIVIFGTDCGIVASAGMDGEALADLWREWSFLMISVRSGGVTVATVGVSQRFSIIGLPVRDVIRAELDRCLPSFIPQSIEFKIRMKLLAGARDGVSAKDAEIVESEEMMGALGFLKGSRCFVFALVFSAPGIRIPRFAAELRDKARHDGENGRTDVLFLMEGNAIYGCFLSDDAYATSAGFNESCRTLLTTFLSLDVWVLAGVATTGAAGLLNGLTMVRYAVAHGQPNWGHITPLNDGVYSRMLDIERTDDAVDMLIGQIAGRLLPGDAMLVDTLRVLAESDGSKTEACTRLGVKRQTLYNRLDKVTELTGIEQRDHKAWNSLLTVARLIAARRNGQ